MGVFTTVKTNDKWGSCQIKTGNDSCEYAQVGTLLVDAHAEDGWYVGTSGARSYDIRGRHMVFVLMTTVVSVALLPEDLWDEPHWDMLAAGVRDCSYHPLVDM